VLGLYNSVWHWFRPGETFTLAGVGQFIVSRQLAVLGCEPDLAVEHFRNPTASRGGLGVRAAGASER
jgi:hypothetical protein